MRMVLDSSVSLAWVLPDGLQDNEKRIREDYRKRIHECLAPEIFLGENANALIKAERRKTIQFGMAHPLLLDILSTQPVFHPFAPLVASAMSLASKTGAGFFDCAYLILAAREKCEFVTADIRTVNALSGFPVSHLSTF
ncbi:unnamed protein product [uncultured bacterium]|nr:unnamed protein product [uncultured bacterium]